MIILNRVACHKDLCKKMICQGKHIYDSIIIIKDIVQRFNVKDIDLLNRIVTYVLTTPFQTFSPESLKKYIQVAYILADE